MYQLTNITNKAKQTITWSNGDLDVDLYFEYKPNQLGWFIDIKYQDLVNYRNIRVTTHRNLLRSYSAILPFGMMITTSDGLEPMGIDDFTSGYATVYILTRDECKQIEEIYYA